MLRRAVPLSIVGLVVLVSSGVYAFCSETKPSRTGKVCVVLDDGGATKRSPYLVDSIASSDIPATVAVMPHSLTEEKTIGVIAESDFIDPMLHQPMEPQNIRKHRKGLEVNPRTYSEKYDPQIHAAIYNSDSPELAKRILLENIERQNEYLSKKSSKKVIGFNNHMGSRLTENEKLMYALSETALDNELIVLDSMTIASSRLYRVANNLFSGERKKRKIKKDK